jgi:hypothetical protein
VGFFGFSVIVLLAVGGPQLGCGAPVAKVVPPVIDLAECIIGHVVGCATAAPPTPWAVCAEQTALACGTDAASVVSVWASHRNAELREADAGVSYP